MTSPRAVNVLVALLLAMSLAPASADEPGHITTADVLENPEILLPLSGDAYLRRTATVDLAPGMNLLTFAFGQLSIPLDKLEIAIVAPSEGVGIKALTIAPEAGTVVRLEIAAEKACEATILMAFPLKGIEWRCAYTATIDRDRETLDISAAVVFTNKSKIEFEMARVELPGGHIVTTPLRLNETFEVPLFSADAVAYRAAFIYDPARYSGGTTAILAVMRDRDDIFCSRPVPTGSLRLFATGSSATDLGSTTLPYLAPHEPVDIRLGTVPEVTVGRKVLASTQVDVSKDIRNKLVLFHQDDTVEFEVKNARKTPVVLRALRADRRGDDRVPRADRCDRDAEADIQGAQAQPAAVTG